MTSERFEVIRFDTSYKGRLRIVREKVVRRNMAYADLVCFVDALRESYDGEKDEFWHNLEDLGIATIANYQISEEV